VSFTTKDPAKADGEESAYQYCGGDPVGKTDPSGLRIEEGGGPTPHTLFLLRVRTYQMEAWVIRKAVYRLLTQGASGAIRGASFARYSTRLEANMTAKVAARLLRAGAGAARFVSQLDSRVDKVIGEARRYSTLWDAYRPEIRVRGYHDYARRAYFLNTSYWQLNTAFRPSSGYRPTWSADWSVVTQARMNKAVREVYVEWSVLR
jgi:hypothetical protein